jgi:hypothetical protein
MARDIGQYHYWNLLAILAYQETPIARAVVEGMAALP